jgi:hypothetical protein
MGENLWHYALAPISYKVDYMYMFISYINSTDNMEVRGVFTPLYGVRNTGCPQISTKEISQN